MAQSLRNSLKRQSLCWGSENWPDRLLPWTLAGEEADTGLELEPDPEPEPDPELDVPAFAAEKRTEEPASDRKFVIDPHLIASKRKCAVALYR